MNTDTVLGYRRPAMLGGPASPDPDALTVRWYGTSNFELNFRDRVVLLDTFYDRGPRMRGVGFTLRVIHGFHADLTHPEGSA